jgi:hypothetical protein
MERLVGAAEHVLITRQPDAGRIIPMPVVGMRLASCPEIDGVVLLLSNWKFVRKQMVPDKRVYPQRKRLAPGI